MKRITVVVLATLMILGQANAQTKQNVKSEKTKTMNNSETPEHYTFELSDKVTRQAVTFKNRYGITLSGDLYLPKDRGSEPLAALAISGPFGAVKEQSSGLYAQTMAERGFATLAFDPSYTGESGGEPRNLASPDINTEDFSAAVDFLGLQKNVDRNNIGIIGICGFGGMALNATAVDKRVKAVATTSTPRGFHENSVNSNGAWTTTNALSFMNMPLLTYIKEISPRPVLIIAGSDAHSRYFSEDAYKAAAEPKELMIIPNAVHVDLYDKLDLIPFDKLESFFKESLK
ncbi:MAG: alpha/beta hydrolase [Anditalea sp.]